MDIDEEQSAASIPEWFVTFGDMMALLLTFFIMFVSMSDLKDEAKFAAMAESMRRQFGEQAVGSAERRARPRSGPLAAMAAANRARRTSLIDNDQPSSPTEVDSPAANVTSASLSPDLVLEFSGDAIALTSVQEQQLLLVAGELAGASPRFDVRGTLPGGHLDEISERDAWELAFRRAKMVARHLAQTLKLNDDAVRISVSNGGDTPSSSDDHSGRVEVYLRGDPSRSPFANVQANGRFAR